MSKEEVRIFQKFQLYRPYIRSLAAFIHFLRYSSLDAHGVDPNYKMADLFIRQLEKDLTEPPPCGD